MAGHDPEVVKWFTRARRFPKLIGKTYEGTRIPGGPYTIAQAFVFGVLFVLMAAPPHPWAVFGGLPQNAAFFVLVVLGGVFLTGRLPLGMRNPLVWAEGLARVSSPRPINVRLPAPRTVRGATVMVVGTTAPPDGLADLPDPNPAEVAANLLNQEPTPAPDSASGPQPPFTGVQRLLAASANFSKE